ncbi:MAG: hypothetical protein LBS65_10830 [Desulfovibrio sp.]|jgi:cytochrome c553|nr:hypothetical protein [Desulfovibrio sp.]
MVKGFIRQSALIFTALAFCLVFSAGGRALSASPTEKSAAAAREKTGILRIKPVAVQEGELAPVPFDHERHTSALDGIRSCANCHEKRDTDAYSPVFKSVEASDAKGRMLEFHNACGSCHAQFREGNKPSGPVGAQCRSCHTAPVPGGTRADGGLDLFLHYRHITAMAFDTQSDRPCATCHHEIKTPLPGPLTEASCRSCHRENPAGKPLSFAKLAHNRCISCHLDKAAGTQAKGPVTCAGCHDPDLKKTYTRPVTFPRLAAGQPEALLMPAREQKLPISTRVPEATSQENTQRGATGPVAFNHALHERNTAACRSCHHAATEACSACHTLEGTEGRPTLFQVMHAPASERSCFGCHETRKTREENCAACHTPRKAERVFASDCALCHAVLPVDTSHMASAGEKKALAEKLLAARAAARPKSVPKAPETVFIGSISKEYAPAIFPHGRIVKALEKGITDFSPAWSGLHAAKDALCGFCHHYSPVAANPQRCVSCHAPYLPTGKTPDRKMWEKGAPRGLKQAYHQQCMGCHERMNLKEPASADCVACHALPAEAHLQAGQ